MVVGSNDEDQPNEGHYYCDLRQGWYHVLTNPHASETDAFCYLV